MKKGDLALSILLVLLLASGLYYRSNVAKASGTVAVITVDGKEIRRIDLSGVTDPYTFRLQHDDTKWDVIEVDSGRIRIAAASCPQQIAVKQGWIDTSIQPIVCLPNRVVISIEGKNEARSDQIDGISY